ncbi:MAG: hypothetical protein IKL55_06620 [Clostridia bacterium]|nr:hypothetical protein [Clostridia bacterium]
MELVNLGEMHIHMREKFENDPCREHYEKVYTACAIHPNAKHNPSKFYITILSEAIRNLKDPDYKNYRYKFISRRLYQDVNPEEFRGYAEKTMAIMAAPEYDGSYIAAHVMNRGVAIPYQLDELMQVFENALQTGDWSSSTGFSFSLVSNIHNENN